VNILLILAAAAVLWTVVRGVLRLTARLFSIGCLALVGIAALAWILGWVG
jgi:hypothetical protein